MLPAIMNSGIWLPAIRSRFPSIKKIGRLESRPRQKNHKSKNSPLQIYG
jgi:hypothetical protein